MAKKSRRPVKTEQKPSPPATRLGWLDGLRGAAVLAMVAYHFGFDLNYLGWIHQKLQEDSAWLMARSLILGSFLFLAGASYALAQQRNMPLRQHLTRIARIAAAALLVTLGSWLVFRNSAIYFGTLHAIAVMGLLLLALPNWGWGLCLLGALVIGIDLIYANEVFNQPALSWLGLRTFKPQTEDYVPLIPWFGACLMGCGTMRVALRANILSRWSGADVMPSWLIWTGRHSLAIYLMHQPILLGMLIPLSQLLRS
ncbi:MAG: DUF1624 domain-containing protein [Sulfuritalea sp.]|jgi:uncharacterized membrane protein|nr:DUF1624 domain-containing protein [Sulfuritalea sp.]